MSQITCLSCMAAQQGLNCWQIAATPCCKRDRSQCATCHIHAQISKATALTQTVSITLKDGRCLQGTIHVVGTGRLSDHLNGPEAFVILTEVMWSDEDSGAPDPSRTAVLFVAKNHIALVQPIEEPPESEGWRDRGPRPTKVGSPQAAGE